MTNNPESYNFYTEKTECELSQAMYSCFGSEWRDSTPIELIRNNSAKFLGIKIKISKMHGIGNDLEPHYIIDGAHVVHLYVSNENTVCGECQMIYFMLQMLISKTILNELNKKPLFDISGDNSIYTDNKEDKPIQKKKMSDSPGLHKNAKKF